MVEAILSGFRLFFSHRSFRALDTGGVRTHFWQEGEEDMYNIWAIFDAYLRSCKVNPIVFTSTHLDLPAPTSHYLGFTPQVAEHVYLAPVTT